MDVFIPIFLHVSNDLKSIGMLRIKTNGELKLSNSAYGSNVQITIDGFIPY